MPFECVGSICEIRPEVRYGISACRFITGGCDNEYLSVPFVGFKMVCSFGVSGCNLITVRYGYIFQRFAIALHYAADSVSVLLLERQPRFISALCAYIMCAAQEYRQ